MALEAYEAWLCTDCGLIIANGDDSGIEDPVQHYEGMRLHRLRAGSDGHLVVSGCNEGDYCDFEVIPDHECRYDKAFSSISCDGCGTTLAGHRYAASYLVKATGDQSRDA